MLTILFLLIWRTVATIHGYVKAYAPSNIAIAYLSSPRRLKWAIPVGFVAVPAYLWAAKLTTMLAEEGASQWTLVLALVCFVDACKFGALAIFAPIRGLRTVLARA
ncbi:hypothetical protein ACFVDI_04360 [Nocardioides sp. NPDC057767]|uniref:hypothetical protein n=1 Tax=unclassified Nocardioides TaxID=2615069 RepID=UPI003319A957